MKKQIITGILLLSILCGIGQIESVFAENNDYKELREAEQIDTPIIVKDRETLLEILEDAAEQCQQPPIMDMSEFPQEYGLEIDVKNVYYELLSRRQDLLYTYDITTALNEQGFLQCEIEYMPYRTGNFPDNFDGIEGNSLNELLKTAETHLSEDSVNIRIMNPGLQMGDLAAVLSSQVGGGYVFYRLNKDATSILMEPAKLKEEPVTDKEEALQKLERADKLAQQVVDTCTNADMTQMEKARALYAYLTENVVYDYRYYNDFDNFSDKARTPLGALEDHLAICGGFAGALQILFEKAGIPAYIESGYAGEDHIWTIAKIEDTWRLFDATFDAGRKPDEWRYFDADIKETTSHVPQRDVVEKLILETISE